LLEAYQIYRGSVSAPWPLSLCGMGPLEASFNGILGVENRGFVQPADLNDVLVNSGVFVMPSHHDHWPLAIVECCAAGLPIICSEACGSAVELVKSYYNGVSARTGDAGALGRRMKWMHENWEKLPQMGRRSTELAAPYSAELWAGRVLELAADAGLAKHPL